jgi:glucose/arabinose dehydrogenase
MAFLNAPVSRRIVPVFSLVMLFFATPFSGRAQQKTVGVPVPPLGPGPFVFDTAEQHKIRVTVVTTGLVHPWAVAFLPDGTMLITERPGRIRLVRNGVLDPKPIANVPEPGTEGNGGLMDIALHPRFAENHLVYFTYDKPVENGKGAPTVARGNWKAVHSLVCETFWLQTLMRGQVGLALASFSAVTECCTWRLAGMWGGLRRSRAA